jgi:protein N-terminal glutamine amidohydrolase
VSFLNEHKYAPYFCEENIWHLCQEESFARSNTWVAFFFNRVGECSLWEQRMAAKGDAVGWDYHVVLFSDQDGWKVWDLDSRFPLGVSAEKYIDGTFGLTSQLLARVEEEGYCTDLFVPLVRLIPASLYASRFESNRSHMKDRDGNWFQPPPHWPAIGTAHNLRSFIEPDNVEFGKSHAVSTLMNLLPTLLMKQDSMSAS